MLIRMLTLLRLALEKTGLLPVIKRLLHRSLDGNLQSTSLSGWKYNLRILAEQTKYAGVEEVHDLPPIQLYWIEKHLRPMLRNFGFETVEGYFYTEVAQALGANTPNAGARRVNQLVSIGSGNCDFEVALAKQLVTAGLSNFQIECMDINSEMLDRGRMLAEREGVSSFIVPLRADFNSWTPERNVYRAVLANQSLHHVTNLEGLFDAIQRSLQPEGVFLVSDMIGRNGHMRWPEALAIVNEFWRQLPARYRFNRQLGTTEEEFLNYDCSKTSFEGIRSQDILPLLVQRFGFTTFVAFGNVIDPFIDRGIGPNFDPASAWDRDFIDRVHAADTEAISAGRIKPTHMIASMSPTISAHKQQPLGLDPVFCVREQ